MLNRCIFNHKRTDAPFHVRWFHFHGNCKNFCIKYTTLSDENKRDKIRFDTKNKLETVSKLRTIKMNPHRH